MIRNASGDGPQGGESSMTQAANDQSSVVNSNWRFDNNQGGLRKF